MNFQNRKKLHSAFMVILISNLLPDSKQLFCRIIKIVKKQPISEFVFCIKYMIDEKYKEAFKDLKELILTLFDKKTSASLRQDVNMLYSAMKENNTKLPKELYDTAKDTIFDLDTIRITKSNRNEFYTLCF